MPSKSALLLPLFLSFALSMSSTAAPVLPGVGAAMQRMIDSNEISGAVTVVTARSGLLHLECTGWADVAAGRAMHPDTLFFIASMTKPLTATAVLMLQDEGKLNVSDPVAKYLPEFAGLKTPSGEPANLTIGQLLTHTSGLVEAAGEAVSRARTLADLIPLYLAGPTCFEPGERWMYCQSGINTAARIVEIVSHKPFDVFLRDRLFKPLGMRNTTHYPHGSQRARVVQTYAKDATTGTLVPVEGQSRSPLRDRPPYGHSGLSSTAGDYARFCQMLLNCGTLDGRRYLSPESFALLTSNHTGVLAAGFVPGSAWGLGVGLVREPQGITAMFSPGSFGHGGSQGTQAWIDLEEGVAYILMVQRSNFPNSDASDVRRAFQEAASDALNAD